MKNRFALLVVLLTAVMPCIPASAQQVTLDPAVASEVLRGTVALQAAGALRDNQQLLLDYQSVAMEQELAQEAVKRGLAERMDVQQELQKTRRQTLVRAMHDDIARSVTPPPEEDVKQAFQKDPQRWTLPAGYQLDVFYVDPANSNALAQARALTGKAVSDDALKSLNARALVLQSSGRWMSSNDLASAIWTNLPAMKQGDGRLFETESGPLLIRRGAYREQRVPLFDEARAEVHALLLRQKQEEAWQKYLVQKKKDIGF